LPPLTDPATWWRRLCWVADGRIAISGDLPVDPSRARAQIRDWREAGITHVVDLREEWTDEAVVATHAPEITYHWIGTHDAGGHQDLRWFETGVAAILEALDDPGARILVHCHMGVNRAPSMALAALLALGTGPTAALDEIRAARPIAGIAYAESAVLWWHTRGDLSVADAIDAVTAVRAWHHDNPCDVGWIISRIRRAEDDE
jgi:protein-tyrosine phosphatase